MSEKLAFIQSNSTKEASNSDVLPTIECALGVGRLVEDVEVDAHYFADLMRRHGMSDGAILATTINLNDDLVVENTTAEEKGNHQVEFGSYSAATQTATIRISGAKHTADYLQEKRSKENPPRSFDVSRFGSRRASTAAVHETSHRIDHATGDEWREEKWEYYGEFAPERRILKAMRKVMKLTSNNDLHRIADALRKREINEYTPTFEQYENAPDERRAEGLSDKEESDWKEDGYFPIRIKFK